MTFDDDTFSAHLAVLEKFRNDPAFSIYWKNWERCQNWVTKCEETYNEHEKKAAWERAQDDINSLLKSMEPDTAEGTSEVKDQDIVMDDNDEMSEFYRISMEHRQQRES